MRFVLLEYYLMRRINNLANHRKNSAKKVCPALDNVVFETWFEILYWIKKQYTL